MPFQVESLLSARLFLSPQLVDGRLYFLSDMGGRISLYRMDAREGGSIPEPLLPRGIALQNPLLMSGRSFFVFPKLGRILIMIDKDGDENYQPNFVPLDGGLPEPVFGDRFQGQQVACVTCDPERNLAVFRVDPRKDPMTPAYLVDLAERTLTDLGSTKHGNWCAGHNENYTKLILVDNYLAGDEVLYLWEAGTGGSAGDERRLLFGVPLEDRKPGQKVPLNSIWDCHFTDGDAGLLFWTSLFDDHYGLGYFRLENPQDVHPVTITGTTHTGNGEIESFEHLDGYRYLLTYNIDGVSYAYEGTFDEANLAFHADRQICGSGPLANGMTQSIRYTKAEDAYALAFSTATSPAQIFTLTGPNRELRQLTNERTLGIPQELLSPGEDASYISHDGLRISSRLYLPAPALRYEWPRPVVFYIHGGPQGQERPDFAWFSMPLIQFLTLNGIAVWVPNVRGSTGYGLDYMSRVDRDWGGLDRLDHVAAFEVLRKDPRVDANRVGVVGRSYGGYMTLTLAGRHPDLWRAAVDMFGPYNLITFMERLPDAWRTHFYLALGDPEKERDEVVSRSPDTYLGTLACPMLVIQGHNDPRVVEAESRDLVERLRGQGKQVELLVFENEGHDVIKFDNKVKCYTEITNFFLQHLCD